jgi:hypothetical protein
MSADFLQTYVQAAASRTGPHLSPVNQTTLLADCALLQQRAGSLQSYQSYLGAARAAKAQNQGATLSFEQTVETQAAQALDDAQTGAAAALRVIQQVNQTSFWTETIARMTTVLGTTGPVSAQQIWNDVWVNQANSAIRAAMQAQGLSDAVASAVAGALPPLNGGFALQGGTLAIQGGAAGAPASTVLIRTPGTAPASVGELLGTGTFDRVVAAFGDGGALYLETIPPAGSMEPADIFAAGAIAVRQHMTDHLRNLQDAGLSALSGSDPLTAALITALVAGLVIGAIGVGILIECDNAQDQGKQPPGGQTLCAIGEILAYLAFLILEMTFLLSGGAIATIAWLAMGALMPEIVANFSQIMPTFTPGSPAPAQ